MIPNLKIIFIAATILTTIEISGGLRIPKHHDKTWKYCHHSAHKGRSGLSLCPWEWVGECQDGKNQSPIDIGKNNQIKAKICKPFKFTISRDVFPCLKVQNNGHTVKLVPQTDSSDYYTMEGGGLKGKYQFWEGHLHWGSENSHGSEHTIDGRHYSMEMHLIFHKKKFANVNAAVESGERNAIAVLARLFKVDDKNKQLDPIFKFFINVPQEGQEAFHHNLPTRAILPKEKERNEFYRYHGSLTTPNCSEVIVWTIFKEISEISQKEMNELRALKHGTGSQPNTPISDNFRPTQEVKGRLVLDVEIEDSSDEDTHECSCSKTDEYEDDEFDDDRSVDEDCNECSCSNTDEDDDDY